MKISEGVEMVCTCGEELDDMEDGTFRCNKCFHDYVSFRGKCKKIYGTDTIFDLNK